MLTEDVDFKSSCLYNLPEKLATYEKIYVYGVGIYGKFIFSYLSENGLGSKLASFVITEAKGGLYAFGEEYPADQFEKCSQLIEKAYGKGIKLIDDVLITDNDIVLIAAKKVNRSEMLTTCNKRNIKNVLEIDIFDLENYVDYPRLEQDDPILLKCWYKMIKDEDLDLNHPKTYNEKIQWLKIYDPQQQLKTIVEDKYNVKNWVANKIGSEHVVPLLGVWDKFDDIDFDKLPDRFVLKLNVESGRNIIVRDKSKFDIQTAKEKFDKWIKLNAHTPLMAKMYRNIKRKIIAETYIEDINGDLPDYKFFCFNGEIKFIQVYRNRWSHIVRRCYDTQWNPLPFGSSFSLDPVILPKPKPFEKMLEIVKKLSEDFIHVRVDIYVIGDKVYFGEMTFNHKNGLAIWSPSSADEQIGEYFKINI